MCVSSSSAYKMWSINYTRTLVLSLLFILVIGVMAMFMVSAGLRCVDRDGCLREHCQEWFDRFQDPYKALIRAAHNDKCRLPLP